MTTLLATRSDLTLEAQQLIRDPSQFKWYAVTLFALVVLAYANEVERGRLDVVAAGLAVWLADWFNEIVNSVVLELSDRAPLWATTGPTSYQFLVGLNLEISLMFALGGIVFAKLAGADRSSRILGMSSRLFAALSLSAVSILVELFLHETGTFHWEYWWWNTPFLPLVFLFGYLWFYLFAWWVYDAPSQSHRWRRLGGLGAINVVMALTFGPGLGWL